MMIYNDHLASSDEPGSLYSVKILRKGGGSERLAGDAVCTYNLRYLATICFRTRFD